MVHLEVSARVPMPIEEYWAVRTTPEFLNAETKVLCNASKVVTKTKCDDSGRVVYHQMKTKPDLSMVPPSLMAMLSDEGIVYIDEITYITDDPATPYAVKTKTCPNIAQDKCNIVSYMRILPDPADPNACIQKMTVDVSVSLWIIGSAIESLVVNGIRDGYTKLPQIVECYLSQITMLASSSCETLQSVADSDYGSLGDLTDTDLSTSMNSLNVHCTGVKREHDSTPNTPNVQHAERRGSKLKAMLSFGGSSDSLNTKKASMQAL